MLQYGITGNLSKDIFGLCWWVYTGIFYH